MIHRDVQPTEVPHHDLLDYIRRRDNIKSDYLLARHLGIPASSISKVRHGFASFTALMMIRTHKKTGLTIAKIEELLGIEDDDEPTH
jgi:plasmid maintenance system antidote protein VapI